MVFFQRIIRPFFATKHFYRTILSLSISLFLLTSFHPLYAQPSEDDVCLLQKGVSEVVRGVVCPIQLKLWQIPKNATALVHAGCLLGKNRCDHVLSVPTEQDVQKTQKFPAAKNQKYQELALTAEKVVPQTWWRQSFDDPHFLLTPTNKDFPRRMFDIKVLSNKKLRNMYECVTRQQFIRKSLDFALQTHKSSYNNTTSADSTTTSNAKGGKNVGFVPCVAMSDPVVLKFFSLWSNSRTHLDGVFSEIFTQQGEKKVPVKIWLPDQNNVQLFMAAQDVLEYFWAQHGGIWTGCFAMETHADCRGALAAAALVSATHLLADIAGRHRPFSESNFVRGYLLASLGRHLLHGDASSTGSRKTTHWQLTTFDFVALQNAFLTLYIDSFGAVYTAQLTKHVPLAFHPDFPVTDKRRWQAYAQRLEPLYSSVRNWMYTESFALIDFGPYFPLVAFPEVRRQLLQQQQQQQDNDNNNNNNNSNAGNSNDNSNGINDNNNDINTNNKNDKMQKGGRRVLIDVGANGFFASPKYLLDSYAPFLPFTHALLVEPEPHFSASVPRIYAQQYVITQLPIYAEVATASPTDILTLLQTWVTAEDFVVLKFDVDPNKHALGPTMEWGFLFAIMQQPEIAGLVDEVYIELHYHFPLLYWQHYHSNWEALDTLRYLREKGAIVHSWP